MSDNLTLTLSVPPTFLTKIAQEYGQIKQNEHKLLVQDLSGWLDKFIGSTFTCSAKPDESGTGTTGSAQSEDDTAEGADAEGTENVNAESVAPPPGSAFKKLCEHLFEQPGFHTDISKALDPNLYKEYGVDLDRMADILSTFCGVTSSTTSSGSSSTENKSNNSTQWSF